VKNGPGSEPKQKMGRPALPRGQVKAVFAIRLSAEERAALDAAAERAGKPVSQWAREALLASAAR